MTKKIFITGAAGFIGFHLANKLLSEGHQVYGFDGITNYYDPALKHARIAILRKFKCFDFLKGQLEEPRLLCSILQEYKPDVIIHLAAQAGVRYSIDEPRSYVTSNLVGTHEVLEAARLCEPTHLLMASTSSAYGANEKMPYKETDGAVHPMSFYAATKLANEAMAHSYAHLYRIPTTMFRFFTVYGPWGRPDMALFKFTKAILNDDAIDVFNHGLMKRDFTYIDDLVEGITRLIDVAPNNAPFAHFDSSSPVAPFRVVNIGNGEPSTLQDFICAIELATGMEAKRNLLPMQPGDVPATWANDDLITALIGKLPKTELNDGVREFVKWYREWVQ